VRIWGKSRIRHHSARRLGLAVTGLALVAGALPVVGSVVSGSTGIALADDTMASLNAMRTGWDNNEPALNPTAVHTMSSSPVWNLTLPDGGSVYGQPLVIGSEVIVATEKDDVYAYQNNGSGVAPTPLWSTPLGTPVQILTLGGSFSTCTDLQPYIGVTGTPVYDGAGHIFMFADEMVSGVPKYFFVELNTSDGTLVQPQVQIKGAPSNATSGNNFNAKYQMERPGVYFDPATGAVFAAFASHCDIKPYDGYVIRVAPGSPPNNTTVTATYSLWSDESKVSYDQAGIWQGGGGVMADPAEPGSIYVTSGNGVSPPKGPGSKPPGTLAESVIRLVTNSNGTLSPKDFFSPANAPTLDAGDIDYGSGGPVGVPFVDGNNYQTVAQVGKDGRIWLLNSQNLGGREQGTNSTDASLFVGHAYGGVWGHPAVFGDTTATLSNAGKAPVDNDFLVSIGRNDVMRVFRFAVTTSNKPWLSNIANSTLSFGFSSGSPIVTSTQNSNPVTEAQSAVIWAVDAPKNTLHPYSGLNSELEAYTFGAAIANGKPSTCQSSAPCPLPNIWHSTTFISSKFSIPAVSAGWIYVGTRDGHLLAFAPGGTPAPAVASTAMLQTAVGTTSSSAVTVTAIKNVIVTGATASTGASNDPNAASEFGVTGQPTVNGNSATFPVHLKKGDKLSVTTTFTPSVAGASNGTLSLSTSSTTVDVPLTGEGTQQGIYAETTNWAIDPAAPGTQTFPWEPDQHIISVPVGIQVPEIVDITNLGTVTQTITKVIPPSGQFTATNLPAVGTKLIPGQSTPVQVTYKPTSAGPATGSFTVVGSSGQKAVVTLSGIGTAAVSQFTAGVSATPVGTAHAAAMQTAGTPVTLDFGSVPVGTTVTNYIQVNNSGNTETLLGATANLAAPFSLPIKASFGLPVNPDADLSLPVTFAPTATGTFTAQYRLIWRDVNGRHTLIVNITGTGV